MDKDYEMGMGIAELQQEEKPRAMESGMEKVKVDIERIWNWNSVVSIFTLAWLAVLTIWVSIIGT